jgi:hypothetical protein
VSVAAPNARGVAVKSVIFERSRLPAVDTGTVSKYIPPDPAADGDGRIPAGYAETKSPERPEQAARIERKQ